MRLINKQENTSNRIIFVVKYINRQILMFYINTIH